MPRRRAEPKDGLSEGAEVPRREAAHQLRGEAVGRLLPPHAEVHMKREAKMFGIVSKSGQIWTGSEYQSEKLAWEIAFECANEREIGYMRSKGCRCVPVTITWEEQQQ